MSNKLKVIKVEKTVRDYTRDDVIDESIRHLKKQKHIRTEICIYCGDCDEIPNPFYLPDIPTIGALHYVGHAGKPELCPVCNPEVRKRPSPWWK